MELTEKLKKQGWVEITLDELADFNLNTIDSKTNFKNIIYLDTGSITENKIESLQSFKITESPSRAKRMVKNNDIVYSTVRPNQKHYGYMINPPENLIVSTGFCVISTRKEIAVPKFIYYLLTQNSITNFLQQIAEHSTSTYPAIRPEQLEKMDIFLPPLSTQNKIADILSSLDDKIELLKQQNKILEETAQTIFKEWFGKYSVDRPEELPEGWRVGNLLDVAVFLNGVASQKYPPKNDGTDLNVIKIKELNSGISENTDKSNCDIDPKYLVSNGDVLFSWSGSLDVKIWYGSNGVLNQHLFKVSSERYHKWFYFFWLKYHLEEFRNIANTKATTMGHIQRVHLGMAKVIIPGDEELDRFNLVMDVLLRKEEQNNFSSKFLLNVKDLTLPKLVNGEVEII